MKRSDLTSIIIFSLAGAFVYCLLLYFFLVQDRFEGAWIMYIGNLLFGITVSLYMLYNATKQHGQRSLTLVGNGFIITFSGIIMSALLAFALLALVVPNYFTAGWVQTIANSGVREMSTNNGQLTMAVYMNLVLGNLVAGSFASIIYVYSARPGKREHRDKQFG